MSILTLTITLNTLTQLFRHNLVSIFEIYPQQKIPKLAKIAELNLNFQDNATCSLNGNRVVIYGRKAGTVIVWDFVANTATSWSITKSDTSQCKVCYIPFSSIQAPILFSFKTDSQSHGYSHYNPSQIPP